MDLEYLEVLSQVILALYQDGKPFGFFVLDKKSPQQYKIDLKRYFLLVWDRSMTRLIEMDLK